MLGLLAAVVATGTLVQRTRADARTAWWQQVEWAIDEALGSSPDEQVVGLQALITLTDDVTERPFWSAPAGGGGGGGGAGPEDRPDPGQP